MEEDNSSMNKTAKKLFVNGKYTHMTEFNKEAPKP